MTKIKQAWFYACYKIALLLVLEVFIMTFSSINPYASLYPVSGSFQNTYSSKPPKRSAENKLSEVGKKIFHTNTDMFSAGCLLLSLLLPAALKFRLSKGTFIMSYLAGVGVTAAGCNLVNRQIQDAFIRQAQYDMAIRQPIYLDFSNQNRMGT